MARLQHHHIKKILTGPQVQAVRTVIKEFIETQRAKDISGARPLALSLKLATVQEFYRQLDEVAQAFNRRGANADDAFQDADAVKAFLVCFILPDAALAPRTVKLKNLAAEKLKTTFNIIDGYPEDLTVPPSESDFLCRFNAIKKLVYFFKLNLSNDVISALATTAEEEQAKLDKDWAEAERKHKAKDAALEADNAARKSKRPVAVNPFEAKTGATMVFSLEIVCENAAFDPCLSEEIRRILRALADSSRENALTIPQRLFDANGNVCGSTDWNFKK